MRWKQNLPAVTMLNKTRAPRNWKKCVRDKKGGNLYARHKAREKLAKVKTTLFCFCYSRCRKELSLFRLFAIKRVSNTLLSSLPSPQPNIQYFLPRITVDFS